MKTKLTATSAAMFALLGLSRVALADGESRFTAVEDLLPEQRQAVFQKLSEMTNGAELDWDHIAVGVNEGGQVVLVQKDQVKFQASGAPSSFAKVQSESEK